MPAAAARRRRLPAECGGLPAAAARRNGQGSPAAATWVPTAAGAEPDAGRGSVSGRQRVLERSNVTFAWHRDRHARSSGSDAVRRTVTVAVAAAARAAAPAPVPGLGSKSSRVAR